MHLVCICRRVVLSAWSSAHSRVIHGSVYPREGAWRRLRACNSRLVQGKLGSSSGSVPLVQLVFLLRFTACVVGVFVVAGAGCGISGRCRSRRKGLRWARSHWCAVPGRRRAGCSAVCCCFLVSITDSNYKPHSVQRQQRNTEHAVASTPPHIATTEASTRTGKKNPSNARREKNPDQTSGSAKPGRPTKLHNYLSLCLLYTSPSPRDRTRSRMPSSA